jgi:hypothetical protein
MCHTRECVTKLPNMGEKVTEWGEVPHTHPRACLTSLIQVYQSEICLNSETGQHRSGTSPTTAPISTRHTTMTRHTGVSMAHYVPMPTGTSSTSLGRTGGASCPSQGGGRAMTRPLPPTLHFHIFTFFILFIPLGLVQ